MAELSVAQELTIADRLQIIDQFQIDEPSAEIQKLGIAFAGPDTDKKEAFVDDGSLVSFVAGVPPSIKAIV